MARKQMDAKPLAIDVFLGGTPLLEPRIIEGLLAFGKARPRWRFSMRGSDYRYRRDDLRRNRPDGVIVSIDHKAVSRMLGAAAIPWVCLLPNAPIAAPYVTTDNPAIGKLASDYFLNKGFRHFAFCGVVAPWSDQRKTAFIQALAGAGQPCRVTDVDYETSRYWEFPAKKTRPLVAWLKSLPPRTALFVAHDSLAARLVDLCLQQSIRIPQEIAILSVGDHDIFCQLSPVGISSINANVPRLAENAAVMLERILQGQENVPSAVIAPRGIVERRSTEIVAYADELVGDIVSYIRDHACDGITVDSILKQFPVARRTLLRRFQQTLGHSPVEEIGRARFRHARRLLTQTDLSLTRIAVNCGYADLSHLCRACRVIEGVSPGALRKKNR